MVRTIICLMAIGLYLGSLASALAEPIDPASVRVIDGELANCADLVVEGVHYAHTLNRDLG